MMTRPVSVPRTRDGDGPPQHSETRESAAHPFVLRLDRVLATAENRYRISERVRRLNRALEESGTPFRLRLL